MAYIFAVSGMKNSGKTKLCLLLLKYLKEAGIHVGYIKHSHEKVLSPMDTDTGKVLSQGIPALYWGVDGCRYEKPGEISIYDIQNRIGSNFDILLLEGGKSFPCHKIWLGEADTCPGNIPGIVAYYEAIPAKKGGRDDTKRFFSFGEESSIADFIIALYERSSERLSLIIEGEKIPLRPFVSDFIEGGIKGMLSSLKKIDKLNGDIAISIKKEKDK
ncbi:MULTISPECIES: molybdopterin-guanine dinucleotide biosynthesis protein MobB [Aminobacterium]|jgi:molybdopterin-guanine dinucleotide biosynthesis protein B|uniref:Molybdopterin-guanine dinucleotide biosynthesis protein-like protein n=1 Tax=Aminobacterium colombiense (strain DSM 12261 / ALA-1) TaxID=572547 RepID=D5EDT8_AMICL|nr:MULTISPECIES: molybdopterin-guanine dinucleotide biosynthesis protein MobB [Aminobacterium]MDD2379049.1 molybdopterin-guanine dinucleotide biosynthesis protein MobB [Aminobacterium colombiense]ADE56720.1 Molybdopterin-guanine dinucleotide biosynthesis protein-like protein [Aminobacterium colombiense DSM 12261]MDD3767310.1 molybdopterin-guanine dinucleotide biosynthesis protein MobB [Aminobacterium colombiense]MDD4265339.1 molybdopterin-guanine dinucleotide biosynthesis protein MobB [Aminobac